VFGINNPVRWVDPSGLFIISAMVNPTHNFGLGPILGIGPIINHNPIVGVNTGAGTSVNQSSAGAGTSVIQGSVVGAGISVIQGSVVGAASSLVTSVNMILIGTQFFGLAAACPTKRKLDTGGSGGGGKGPGGGTKIPSGAGVPTPPTRIVTPQPIPKTQTPASRASTTSSASVTGLKYEASAKHASANPRWSTKGKVNPAPRNGQAALNNSIQVKSTSTRRVGVDHQTGQFNVFDETSTGVFHGHVRSWNELTIDMQNALKRANLVDSRGNILRGGN